MNFLDNYDLESIDQFKLHDLEYEVKESLIKFSDYSLQMAIKAHKAFSPSYVIGFMTSYITFVMIEWLGESDARLHKDDIIKAIRKEAYQVNKLCNRYKPHQDDIKRSERLNMFRTMSKSASMVNQTIQIQKSICDNAIESGRSLKLSGQYSSKGSDNLFNFLETIPLARNEASKLKQEVSELIFASDDKLNGLLTKQLARQIAWLTGFFADLDKDENVSNIMDCISGVLETLDFNELLLQIEI